MNTDQRVNVNMSGEVVEKNSEYLMVETTAIDRKGNLYGTNHVVKMVKHKVAKGSFVHIEGHLDMDENGVNYIDPVKFEVLTDKLEPEDCKMNAWITAEASSNFIEPMSLNAVGLDKKPFGVASVKVGTGEQKRFQRGIVFNNLIALFRKNLKTGAIVKLAGRIQYRDYETKDGEARTVAEIICDNNYTAILKASTKKDPFAFSDTENNIPNGKVTRTIEPVRSRLEPAKMV